ARDQELPSSVCVADFDIVQSTVRHSGGGPPASQTAAAAPATAVAGPAAAVAAAAAASRERLLAEGQVLTAVTQVLDSLFALSSPNTSQPGKSLAQQHPNLTLRYEVRISHRVLLASLMASCGVAPGQATEQVLAQCRTALSISPLDGGPTSGGVASSGSTASSIGGASGAGRAVRWGSIQKALEGLRMRPDAVNRVRTALMVLPGPLLPSLDRTSAFIKDWQGRAINHPASMAAASRAAAALAELQLLARYLSLLSIPSTCLILDPLMPMPEAYFSHTYFTVHVRLPHTSAPHATHSMMVAAGGRYDSLVRSCWPTHTAPGAVGATLNIEKLVDVMGGMLQASACNATMQSHSTLPQRDAQAQCNMHSAATVSGQITQLRCTSQS
ncbi:hypothetical protein DUNSADRAFT_2513, partial [Dunaliella salina]